MDARNRQAGLAAAAIVVLLVLGLVALIFGARYFDSALGLDRRAVTDANMRRISDALSRFVTLNQRLPCPAAGNSDAGTENSGTPFATCNSPDGVVPWATLALRRDETLDGWSRKISYRVFSGNTGLTQLGGASMSDCNTNGGASDTVNGSGLCPAARQTPPAAFLAGKGLSIQTDAGTTGGFAFVLVSHGESGLGAFAAEGAGRSALPTAGSLELPNAQAGATYNQRARSATTVAPTDVTHFDDTVLAVSVTDVVNAAKLAARDWGPPPVPPPVASMSFTAASVEGALGVSPGSLNPLTNANTGQNDIDFGDFRVRAFGSTGRNVSFGQGSSGTGIGSIGSSNTSNNNATINEQTGESLRFQFDTPGRYLGITLIDFGTQSGQFERVRFTFDVGGSTVQVTKTACRAGNVLANFTVNPGGDFDEVFVEARSTSGGADSSRFLIKAIATCPSTNPACAAPGAAAGDNCP